MPAHPDPRRRKRHVRRTACLALSCLVLATAGVGTWLFQRMGGNVRSVDINAELGADRPDNDPRNPSRHLLLLGADSAVGEESAMVVHLPGDRDAVPAVVSIPRDTLLGRPECAGTGGPAFFHEIYEEGGPSCAVRTVEELSDIRMDHYLEVDFAGFAELVDALGGITVKMDRPVRDAGGRKVLAAGSHRLDGRDAVAAVRAEQRTEGSDLRQRFLLAALREVNSQDVLSNPATLYRVADAATRSLTADAELDSLPDLLDFAKRLRSQDGGRLTTLALPVERDTGRRDNGLVPRQPQADSVWEALRDGTTIPRDVQ